jgi:hypothetical protein
VTGADVWSFSGNTCKDPLVCSAVREYFLLHGLSNNNTCLSIHDAHWGFVLDCLVDKKACFWQLTLGTTLLESSLTAPAVLSCTQLEFRLGLKSNYALVAAYVKAAKFLKHLTIVQPPEFNLPGPLENTSVVTVRMTGGDRFTGHQFPRLENLHMGSLAPVIEGSAYPLMRVVKVDCPMLEGDALYVVDVVRKVYESIVLQVPSLLDEPIVTFYEVGPVTPFPLARMRRKLPLNIRRRVLSENAPHLVPVFDFNTGTSDAMFFWVPKLHRLFGSEFAKLAAVFLMACDKLTCDGAIQMIHPAIYENILRSRSFYYPDYPNDLRDVY